MLGGKHIWWKAEGFHAKKQSQSFTVETWELVTGYGSLPERRQQRRRGWMCCEGYNNDKNDWVTASHYAHYAVSFLEGRDEKDCTDNSFCTEDCIVCCLFRLSAWRFWAYCTRPFAYIGAMWFDAYIAAFHESLWTVKQRLVWALALPCQLPWFVVSSLEKVKTGSKESKSRVSITPRAMSTMVMTPRCAEQPLDWERSSGIACQAQFRRDSNHIYI